MRSMTRPDAREANACRFAEIHASGIVENPCGEPGRQVTPPYLLHAMSLCEAHEAVLIASGRMPVVGDWNGKRWVGLPK